MPSYLYAWFPTQEWCDNGVFVFRKGKEVNICIKLPIRVEMEGRYVFIMSLI